MRALLSASRQDSASEPGAPRPVPALAPPRHCCRSPCCAAVDDLPTPPLSLTPPSWADLAPPRPDRGGDGAGAGGGSRGAGERLLSPSRRRASSPSPRLSPVAGGGPPPCHAPLSLRPQVVAEELEERGEGWKRKSSLGRRCLKHPYPRNRFLSPAPGRKGAGGRVSQLWDVLSCRGTTPTEKRTAVARGTG
uniref:Uncharacterized protein n=1 Tax=Oryza barthii TaxID=65489 RepID=A0A0D3HM41_9ORYZ